MAMISPGPRGRSFSKSRLEAFSDGVFAIAITLLILDVAVTPGGSPLEEVLAAWPSYVGYVVSFMTIGVAWVGHTALTDELDRVDPVFLRLNLLLLLVVVFLPFPTTLVTEALGDRDAERVAATVYGVTLLAIRLLGMALDKYAQREGLYKTFTEDVELDRSRRKAAAGVILYVVAIVTGLVLPGIAVAVYFAIALYLVIPFRELAVVRRRRVASAQSVEGDHP
jgi:uncharacterized membrane protein